MAKILVVDDSAFMRTYLRGLLEEAGFEVEEFVPLSSLEVIDRVRTSKPDLVLSDYNMPNVDGQSVARMARKASPAMPILILTALHDPAKEEALRGVGVSRILHKPLDGKALVQAIREFLG